MSRTALVRGLVAAIVVGTAAAGTTPAVADSRDRGQQTYVRTTLAKMSLEQKVGQLFVPYVNGASADEARAENLERFGVATPAEAVAKLHLGGVIYFAWSDNTANPEQIAGLSNGLQQAALAPSGQRVTVPLSIATDQETGLVARVGPPATVFPGAMALGASRSTKNTRDTYTITGQELRAIGINTDYAPDADVNVNPANPIIGVRSFSSRPALVSEHVTAAIEGLHAGQVSSTAKHFPGHGDTSTDSHTALPVITHTRAEWEKIDAPPFRAAIKAGVDSIMSAHISFPELEPNGDPSTLSSKVLTGMLREELGFTGVIATDSLRMEGVRAMYSDAEIAIRAVEAGADVLLDPQLPALQYEAVLGAVHDGRLSESRIDQSVRRILAMKYARGVIAAPYADTAKISSVVGTPKHLARAQKITDQTTTVVTDRDRLVPLPRGSVLVTGWGPTQVPQLTQRLSRFGRTATGLVTGSSPTDAAVADAVAKARQHDLTVVTTSAAWNSAGQRKLVTALQATGKPVLVVALRDPYDIAHLGTVRSYVATYSSTTVAIESLARVLEGSINPRGTLPVDITSATDPSTIIYPYGTGLRR